jgi:hypothetical protein
MHDRDVSSFRKNYLEKLEKKNDFFVVWASIWKNEKMVNTEEREYFGIFSKKIDRMIKKDVDSEKLEGVISNFVDTLDDRTCYFIVFNKYLFEKVLEWQFEFSIERYNDPVWFNIHGMINQAFTKIGKRMINEDRIFLYKLIVPLWKSTKIKR